MSVFIKDMKMPKRCLDCPMYDCYNYSCQMYAFGIPARYNRDGSTRPEWCELMEVPTPHGDLIDIDSKITIGIKDGLKVTTVRDLLNDKAVRLPKTIIEAEGTE